MTTKAEGSGPPHETGDSESRTTAAVPVPAPGDAGAVRAARAEAVENGAPDAPGVHAGENGLVVAENDASGPNIAEVSSSDPEGDEITFSVDNDAFEIVWVGSAAILKVRDGVALDHEATEDGTITLNITATDTQGNNSEATSVTVTVTDVNEAPSLRVVHGGTPDAAPVELAIRENTTGSLAAVSLSDPEQALEAGDISVSDPRFAVRPDGAGGLRLELLEGIDAEAEDSLTVELRVVDDGGLADHVEVTITIEDVNEAPRVSVLGSSAPEGGSVRAFIAEGHTGPLRVVTLDDQEEELDTSHITLDNPRFAVRTNDLGDIWLMLTEAIDADAPEGGVVTLTVTVTDDGGLAASAEVTITVENVDEPPTIVVEPGVQPAADGGAGASGAINENATGPVYRISIDDPEDDLTADDIEIDDGRFAVEADSEGVLWVVLAETVNYEEVESIDITLTVRDSRGGSATVERTVTIWDVNDPPEASQDGVLAITDEATETEPRQTAVLKNLTATAGHGILQMRLDLGAMFSDDDGDTNLRYRLENAPDWLRLINVQYGDDGSVTGELSGTVPAGVGGRGDEALDIRIVATDEGGAEGRASFNVVVDDGNDAPTGISLTSVDGDDALFEANIDENDGSGAVLAHLTVEDQDSALPFLSSARWMTDPAFGGGDIDYKGVMQLLGLVEERKDRIEDAARGNMESRRKKSWPHCQRSNTR